MKRTLFVLSMLVVFSMLTGTAFAGESPWAKAPDGAAASPTQNYILMGDQMTFDFLVLDPWFQPWPYFPIDISLYRPSTLAGWPLLQPPTAGAGWLMVGESEFRRQTWPKDKATNEFGLYQAKFMLPRENTWFPCGYPCRWQCDFYDGLADTWDRHAPMVLVALQTLPELLWWPLYWPNDVFLDPVAADAIHPLEAWAFEGGTFNTLAIWEYEVDGYYWKSSDLEVDYPADWPDICPWMLP